jgi:hypothetical protein
VIKNSFDIFDCFRRIYDCKKAIVTTHEGNLKSILTDLIYHINAKGKPRKVDLPL